MGVFASRSLFGMRLRFVNVFHSMFSGPSLVERYRTINKE